MLELFGCSGVILLCWLGPLIWASRRMLIAALLMMRRVCTVFYLIALPAGIGS